MLTKSLIITHYLNPGLQSAIVNRKVLGYLEAAVAWAEDSQGHSLELPEEASWRAFAQFLYCGAEKSMNRLIAIAIISLVLLSFRP
jgi:hypothetical protein